jgi:hypothetical protein
MSTTQVGRGLSPLFAQEILRRTARPQSEKLQNVCQQNEAATNGVKALLEGGKRGGLFGARPGVRHG